MMHMDARLSILIWNESESNGSRLDGNGSGSNYLA
jgi:hypothetical protein